MLLLEQLCIQLAFESGHLFGQLGVVGLDFGHFVAHIRLKCLHLSRQLLVLFFAFAACRAQLVVDLSEL